MLKSKIERATVTGASLDGEDAIVIDRELLKRADIWPCERVEVWNLDNGARLSAYVLEATPLSGEVTVSGPAAHLVRPGHRVVISSALTLTEGELAHYRPRVVRVDSRNRPIPA